MQYAHKDKRFMEDWNEQKNKNRQLAHERQMEQEAPHVATAMRGHDVAERGQDVYKELGMGELGIKQQDMDLDKAAWDFAQSRYDQFGQHADRMGLATSALATRGAMQDFGMNPSEDFWEPYAGMFEEGAPELGPGVTARQRRPNQRTPGIYSRGDAADMEGIPSVKERDIPTQGPGWLERISPIFEATQKFPQGVADMPSWLDRQFRRR